MNVWTPEQDAYLLELCASGALYSVADMAVLISRKFAINPPLKRAAVMGRVRRKKIKLPRTRIVRSESVPVTAPVTHYTNPRPRLSYTPDPRQTTRVEVLPEPRGARGVYLLNASDRDCRWPVNDPPAGSRQLLRVCGEPALDGERYCQTCRSFAYTKEAATESGPFILPSKQRGLK